MEKAERLDVRMTKDEKWKLLQLAVNQKTTASNVVRSLIEKEYAKNGEVSTI